MSSGATFIRVVIWGCIGILLFVLSSCLVLDYQTDTFAGTRSSFRLSKNECRLGDSLSLGLSIRGDAEIKLYEHLEHTLKVWLELENADNASALVWPADSIGWKVLTPRVPGEITPYKISESNPLELKFSVFIQGVPGTDSVAIEIPELNAVFAVVMSSFEEATAIEFHGRLKPARAHPLDPLEDYVDPVRIEVLH